MAKSLRLGLALSEEAYAVTPQQKRQLREAQRIYQSHPIKFDGPYPMRIYPG